MKIGIIFNPEKELAKKIIPEVIKWLKSKGVEVYMLDEAKELLVDECDIILAMGGDGTLLRAARIVGEKGKLICGVNLGKLGFLTDIQVVTLYHALENILKGNYKVEEKMVLEANFDGKKLYGLNDIVLIGTGTGRMLTTSIYINDEFLSTFSLDGVIVSTPTGSTAYSLSAMGPIVHPSLDAILINFICPHTLGARPLVIDSKSIVKIKLIKEHGVIVADGQQREPIPEGCYFSVKKAHYKIKIIRSTKYSFYNILRTKLNWGGLKER